VPPLPLLATGSGLYPYQSLSIASKASKNGKDETASAPIDSESSLMPCWGAVGPCPRSVAVLFDPVEDFEFRKTEVGLDFHIRYQAPLHVTVNGLHVDFEQCFQVPGRKQLRGILPTW